MVTKNKKATLSNRQKEAIGMRVVQGITRESWDCGWQELDARNDNGIDGVIIMRKRGRETGGIVFIQVKCGGDGYRRDQVQHPDKVGVNLGKDYIREHLPRWNSTIGPSVIVFIDDTVDPKDPPAWWADLKDPSTYSSTNAGMVLIPKSQRFGPHSKGDFHRLCGSGPIDKVLPLVELTRDELVIPDRLQPLIHAARGFYKAWSQTSYTARHPTLGQILVNRVGWRHITRQKRLKERVFQSLSLLSAAKRIAAEVNEVDMLGRPDVTDLEDGAIKVTDHLGLRATVIFPHRHQSVVQVVLRRERIISKLSTSPPFQRIWFLSVYELRRGAKQS
ncbi:DUF4365 domain-containing protein [Paraburkholderia fungorum]|uniref:DUF4365 domain-containing protein n=1 Tax=Paraburkholderia fungorum TaxID=134537 RepID=UPI0009E05792|nr:DUF4365 domain-containing protein [Paraburkholderia fungorum]USX08876.1 DUF4365 domain-containing protein [Paraburkholderia fungorum]